MKGQDTLVRGALPGQSGLDDGISPEVPMEGAMPETSECAAHDGADMRSALPWEGQRIKIEDLPAFKARWNLVTVGGDPDLEGNSWQPKLFLIQKGEGRHDTKATARAA
jgi:hypothetical protein